MAASTIALALESIAPNKNYFSSKYKTNVGVFSDCRRSGHEKEHNHEVRTILYALNMELRCALVLRAPCSVSQSTVLCVTEHCALGLRALCSGSQTTMLCVSEIIHYSLHVC